MGIDYLDGFVVAGCVDACSCEGAAERIISLGMSVAVGHFFVE